MSHFWTAPALSRDKFHDAASEISSLTISSGEEPDTESGSAHPVLGLATHPRLQAEDEYGELQLRVPQGRNTKRFSTLSMASSIAAIVPFISASDSAKHVPGTAMPTSERGRPSKLSPISDATLPAHLQARQRLRGSIPQLSLLLQRAVANAQTEHRPSFTATVVDEWTTSLDERFEMDDYSSQITLRFPRTESSRAPNSPAKTARRTNHDEHAKLHDGTAKWRRLRPLSTWGHRSMMAPLWTTGAPAPPSHAMASEPQPLMDCKDRAISEPSCVSANNTATSTAFDATNPGRADTGSGLANGNVSSSNVAGGRLSGRWSSSVPLSRGMTSTTSTASSAPAASTIEASKSNAELGIETAERNAALASGSRACAAVAASTSKAQARQSRFWRLTRPKKEAAAREEAASVGSEVSQLSTEGPSRAACDETPDVLSLETAAVKKEPGPGTKRKRTRLLALWNSLVPGSARHSDNSPSYIA